MRIEDIPGLAEARWAETERFVDRAFRIRFAVLALLVLLLALFVLLDPAPWKAWGTGVLAVVVAVIFVYDLVELRRMGLRESRLPRILTSVFLIQSGLIFVTGAVESPFLPAFLPVALATGLALSRPRQVAAILSVPLSALWIMAFGVWAGLLPNPTPRFWGLREGFADQGAYVAIRCGIYSVVLAILAAQGRVIRRLYERVLLRSLAAEHEARDTLVQTNRELRALTGSLAHELKNPLASVQGLAGLLERALPEGSREGRRAEVLHQEARRMGGVLEGFLNLSRPLAEPSLAEVHPSSLLREVARLHEGMALDRQTTLRVMEGGGPPVCRWDPRKIRQLLANLTINALEAVGPGGQVELEAKAGGPGWVELVVRDSGPGPDPALGERVFEAGVTTKEKGSGLGLTVARALAAQHGGGLRLNASAGAGCELVARLPVAAGGEGQA